MRKKIRVMTAAALAGWFIMTGCTAEIVRPPEDTETDAPAASGETSEAAVSGETGAEPLLLETPAGAVLIGKIRKDADGWYFEPEQPLTVKLTCYYDFTPCYENLTQIRMFDDATDGMNKELYRDETVTVSGMLQNYRNIDALYLYPCRIERGRTEEGCHAAPELEYPALDDPS